MNRLSLAALSAACLAVLALPAGATILIVGDPVISGSGPYTWSYNVSLQNGSEIAPIGAPCAGPIPPGGNCDGLLTIYDFGNYITGTAFAPAGWTFLGANLLGETPIGVTPGSNISTVDNPSIYNLSWAYTGLATVTANGVDLPIGLFGAMSDSNKVAFTEYSARSRRIVSNQSTRSVNLDTTLAPEAIPEPTTSLLLGSALLGLALLRKRLVKN